MTGCTIMCIVTFCGWAIILLEILFVFVRFGKMCHVFKTAIVQGVMPASSLCFCCFRCLVSVSEQRLCSLCSQCLPWSMSTFSPSVLASFIQCSSACSCALGVSSSKAFETDFYLTIYPCLCPNPYIFTLCSDVQLHSTWQKEGTNLERHHVDFSILGSGIYYLFVLTGVVCPALLSP